MPILPHLTLFVILQSWSLVLRLVSAFWYERQLSRYQNHWLVQLHQVADLTPLETVCASFHANNGRGIPITHTTRRLVRALLIKYLFNFSLRQTEEMIDNHILIKWYVGYNLFQAPLDHSYLCRFENWIFKEQPRLFFDTVIKMIDQFCPEDRERLQIVDTFGLRARAANCSLITLLRDVARKTLTSLALVDPNRHATLVNHLDMVDLFGLEDEKITPALTSQERAERLALVGPQILRLSDWLSANLDQAADLTPDQQAPVRLLVAYLNKIMTDETKVTVDEAHSVTVTELKHGDKGSYRVGAAADMESTYRKHRHDVPAILGYNPSVLGSKVFARETQVDTGAQPDNVPLPQLLQNQADYHGFFPKLLAGDMIYGYGKTRAQVAELTHNQTQIVALIPNYTKSSTLYKSRDFTLSNDGLSLTCPNDLTTTSRFVTAHKGGADFRFYPTRCRGCPLWDKCRGPNGKKSVPRNVFISFYRSFIEAAKEFNKSEIFKLAIKQRMNIERIIYCLTNIYGARKAHSYGQARTDFQLKMAATAFNLRQLIRELVRKRHPALGAVRL